AFAAAVVASILVHPGVSAVRRLLSVFVDIGAVTFFMVQSGDHGLPLFLVYVWVTLANGFRFGPKYLVVSLLASLAGFGIVLGTSSYWAQHLAAGAGLA